jgi:predicted ATP-grasp superfamily ATP-dependent carboligase
MKPAVVLSGVTNSVGVVRALGSANIPVVTVSEAGTDLASSSKHVRKRLVAPNPQDDEAQYVKLLMEQRALEGGLLIPTSDSTLVAVARNKSELQKHYVVACPDWEVVERYIDKNITYELAKSAGVPTPRTFEVGAEQQAMDCGDIQYPCLVKPNVSHLFSKRFGTKMFLVNNREELSSAIEEATAAKHDVGIQEFIPGADSEGANYNAYFWDGQPLVEFTARKIRSAPPQTGSPRVLISKKMPEVLEAGRKILRAMSFNGYACTEFKRDPRDGVYKLIEVNGRHNMSSTLSTGCGINFPLLEYNHLMFGERPSAQSFKEGVYWIDLVRDLRYSFGCYSMERFSWTEYLRPYFGPRVFAILNGKDLAPFAMQIRSAMTTMAQGWMRN